MNKFRCPGAVLTLLLAVAAHERLAAADCNHNGADDWRDLVAGTSRDCDLDGIPDECPPAGERDLFGGDVLLGFPARKTIADMDGDNDLDIVTSHIEYRGNEGRVLGSDEIVVLLNRGDGETAREERHALGVSLRDHFEADVDGDGDTDIAALLQESPYRASPRRLRVLFNRGDGSLAAGADAPVPGDAHKPGLADVDGDGDVDFICTDHGVYLLSEPDTIGTELVVAHNDGGGSFTHIRRFPAGNSPDAHALADLDGDGDLDAVVSNTGDVRDGQGPTADTVSVLRNLGGGTFGAPEPHALGYAATSLKAADLDGDGDADILATSWFRPEYTVIHGDGGGGFQAMARHAHAAGTGPDRVELHDLDGDGDLDFTAWRRDLGETNWVAVYRNRGDGAFDTRLFAYSAEQPIASVVADLDGDDDLDVAVAVLGEGKVALHLNDGGGVFAPATHVNVEDPAALSAYPGNVAAGDMDGDGAIDLVAGSVLVFGGGGRTSAGANAGCREFLRGDFNADGQVSLSDVIAIRRWLFSGKGTPFCNDAGDANDDESLSLSDMLSILDPVILQPDWSEALPAPSASPGPDPTYAGDDPGARPLGCRTYDVLPPAAGNASITFGAVVAGPGEEIEIPVLLTSDAPVEGFQLILEHDPERLRVIEGAAGLSFAGTYYETAFAGAGEANPPSLRTVTLHPDAGAFTVAVIGHFIDDGFEVPAGTGVPVARIRAIVPETAKAGTVISIAPAPGSGAAGVGPHRLRNEITVESQARFVSTLSAVGVARINIVGDQAFFRGDSNGDDGVDLADAIFLLGALFLGAERPGCEDAADANDDGRLNISDAVAILVSLFGGGAPLPPPDTELGLDPTRDALRCRPRE